MQLMVARLDNECLWDLGKISFFQNGTDTYFCGDNDAEADMRFVHNRIFRPKILHLYFTEFQQL